MFHHVTEAGQTSSGVSDRFLSYNSARGTVRGYPAERHSTVNCQKVNDVSVLPVLALVIGVNLVSGVTPLTISDIKYDYRRYCRAVDDIGDLPADVRVDIVE